MSKAFIDTTVLFDALIKTGEKGKTAKAALKRYDETEVPVYAFKELKAGPLANFVWFHNKLVLTKSYQRALEVLQRTSLGPKKYTVATALEALAEGARANRNLTSADLVARYGDKARLDSINCDLWRFAIRTAIEKAWKRRRKLTTRVAVPLSCYREADPFEENGVIKLEPTSCVVNPECCLAAEMKARPSDLRKLIDAIDKEPEKPENKRRRKVLKEMSRIPKRYIVTNKECRDLGDAIFALFAPNDSVILTTNVRDHKPLAEALGKSVEEP
jgi:hypothetical protein